MSNYTGYVCVVRHKETKAYGIFPSYDAGAKFEDLGVGDKHELVMNYWVLDAFGVSIKFYKKFAEKRITKSDYLLLNEKDLEEIKIILEEEKKYTDIAIEQSNEAFWLQKFREKREKYSKASDLKKFFMRHDKKFASALGCGLSTLIFLPFSGLAVLFLNAFGISKYFLVIIILGLFSLLIWEGNKQDKYEQEDLLSDEDAVIKKHRKTSKSIKETIKAHKKKNEK